MTVTDNLTKVIAHHNAWADTYDSDIRTMTLYNRITLDNIKRFLPENKDAVILDAGGGTGFWSIEVAKLGYRVVLADLSTGMIKKAKENAAEAGVGNLIDIRVSDITHIPEFNDNQFGMVICEGDPLSYCGDHRAALREFYRVLRIGGAIVASVDNRASAINWLKDADKDTVDAFLQTGDIRLRHENEDFQYLIHTFTPLELTEAIENTGFAVERIIGKPVIARRLAAYNSGDPEIQEWLYQLELIYCDNPAYYPWAGHLEIVGRKMDTL